MNMVAIKAQVLNKTRDCVLLLSFGFIAYRVPSCYTLEVGELCSWVAESTF